jgi:hypothetical protein
VLQCVIRDRIPIGWVLGQGKTFRAYDTNGRGIGLFESAHLATLAIRHADDLTCVEAGDRATD